MSENYRCLFHKIIFHFFILRVFPFVSGWFFLSCLDWSGNYSNDAEHAIQPLDRLDLKFSSCLFRVLIYTICRRIIIRITKVHIRHQASFTYSRACCFRRSRLGLLKLIKIYQFFIGMWRIDSLSPNKNHKIPANT